MVKERRSEKELRQMMLAAARKHEECSELEDLFIFGPTPRPDANWGFGIAGKDNKVSVACYSRLDQIASELQAKYELHPVKAARREIEARVWSLIHDHPTLKASLSRVGGAYEVATFKKLEGSPNWTMEWITDDQLAKAAFERVVRSVQTQIELEQAVSHMLSSVAADSRYRRHRRIDRLRGLRHCRPQFALSAGASRTSTAVWVGSEGAFIEFCRRAPKW